MLHAPLSAFPLGADVLGRTSEGLALITIGAVRVLKLRNWLVIILINVSLAHLTLLGPLAKAEELSGLYFLIKCALALFMLQYLPVMQYLLASSLLIDASELQAAYDFHHNGVRRLKVHPCFPAEWTGRVVI